MSAEELQREREREREHQEHMTNLSFNGQGQLSRGFIRELIDTGDLQDETVRMIQNYLTRSWVLANYTTAQEHDFWYKLDVMHLKILGEHPPRESSIGGPARAFLYDDDTAKLAPLSPQERNLIDSFFDSLKSQLTRNREGFEREMIATHIQESRTDREGEGEKKRGWGLMS